MSALHCTEEYVYVIGILNALLAQSMRWVEVELCVPVAEVARLYRVKGRMPLLRSLVFTQMEEIDDWEDLDMPADPGLARFVNPFEDSPSLTHIELELYMPNLEAWKCNWSSMVILRLKSLSSTDDLVAVLSQSMCLEELQVIWRDVDADSISGPICHARSMITLSSLKKMTLPWNAFDVLEVLTAPGLEHLSIKFKSSEQNAGIFAAFLRRSACPLGHLVLESASPAVVVEVLSVIPGLPSLDIHRSSGLDGTIKLFNCNLPEGALLIGPRLKSLQFCLVDELTQEEVVELSTMVASRAQNVEVDGLQELTLSLAFSWLRFRLDFTILKSQCDEEDVKLTIDGFWICI